MMMMMMVGYCLLGGYICGSRGYMFTNHPFIHSFIHSWHQMGIVSVCHVYLSPLIVTIQQIHWLVDPVNVSPIFPILYSSVPHEIPVCHRHSSNRPDQTFPNFYSHSLFHNVTQSSRLECCFLLSIFFHCPFFVFISNKTSCSSSCRLFFFFIIVCCLNHSPDK